MEQNYIINDVFEQIKDFKSYWKLNEEQKLLIDKLIPNEELKQRYKKYGLCKGCKQGKMNTTFGASHVIQKISKILKWIEYDRFENIEYITKGA